MEILCNNFKISLILAIFSLGWCFMVESFSGNYTRNTRPSYSEAFKAKGKIKRDSSVTGRKFPYYYNSYDSYELSSKANRRLLVPKGTTLTVTPEISIPVIQQKNKDFVDVTSKFTASFPLAVSFNDLSLSLFGDSLFDSMLLSKRKSLRDSATVNHNHMGNQGYYSSNFLGDGSRTSPALSRKSRDLFSYKLSDKSGSYGRMSRCFSRSLSDRKMILQKLEMVLATGLGLQDSRDCLLRAICEFHELPHISRSFGLLGEYLMITISTKKMIADCPQDNYLRKFFVSFAEAEAAGKSGDCGPFTIKCAKSLFTN